MNKPCRTIRLVPSEIKKTHIKKTLSVFIPALSIDHSNSMLGEEPNPTKRLSKSVRNSYKTIDIDQHPTSESSHTTVCKIFSVLNPFTEFHPPPRTAPSFLSRKSEIREITSKSRKTSQSLRKPIWDTCLPSQIKTKHKKRSRLTLRELLF